MLLIYSARTSPYRRSRIYFWSFLTDTVFPGIENIEHWGPFVCIKNTLSFKIWEKFLKRGRVYTLGQIIEENTRFVTS